MSFQKEVCTSEVANDSLKIADVISNMFEVIISTEAKVDISTFEEISNSEVSAMDAVSSEKEFVLNVSKYTPELTSIIVSVSA